VQEEATDKAVERSETRLRIKIANILIRSFWPANTHRAYHGVHYCDGSAAPHLDFHAKRFEVMCRKYLQQNMYVLDNDAEF
jgi:hypothetical protein